MISHWRSSQDTWKLKRTISLILCKFRLSFYRLFNSNANFKAVKSESYVTWWKQEKKRVLALLHGLLWSETKFQKAFKEKPNANSSFIIFPFLRTSSHHRKPAAVSVYYIKEGRKKMYKGRRQRERRTMQERESANIIRFWIFIMTRAT